MQLKTLQVLKSSEAHNPNQSLLVRKTTTDFRTNITHKYLILNGFVKSLHFVNNLRFLMYIVDLAKLRKVTEAIL
jgi:hypothetical protein